jgi:hypothetical protein
MKEFTFLVDGNKTDGMIVSIKKAMTGKSIRTHVQQRASGW